MNPRAASYPDRRFSIWTYKVGHRQLLLRSTGGVGDNKLQIDVLFKNVQFICLPPDFVGLEVREPTSDEEVEARHQAGLPADREEVFMVESRSTRGFVIAGLMRHIEYDVNFTAQSPLLL